MVGVMVSGISGDLVIVVEIGNAPETIVAEFGSSTDVKLVP